VDVHAATLARLESARDSAFAPPATAVSRTDTAGDGGGARVRATRYIDSLRLQPEGVPTEGRLRYEVVRILRAPADSLAVFHVVARDRADPPRSRRANPAWYALDLRTGAVTPIDSITGDATPLPDAAGAWTEGRRFVYAKGLVLYEARVVRAER
jgi:hypothetical protein